MGSIIFLVSFSVSYEKILYKPGVISRGNLIVSFIKYENHDIAIAMSSSRADPVLGLNIL